MSLGATPHDKILYAIELPGTRVAREVRKYTEENKPGTGG
jgi:hypothetical protein